MPPRPKPGPFTTDELRALWRTMVDPAYVEGFEQAGDGRGIEVHEQTFEQFSMLSESIDRSKEALFVRRWSGATNPPASGPARARTTLTVTRRHSFSRAITLSARALWIDQEEIDHSPTGPIPIFTGRRYVAVSSVTLLPGAAGPVSVDVEAIMSGAAHNNAAPGTLKRFDEVAAGYSNTGATVTPGGPLHRLTARNRPDVPVPAHVGRYVQLTDGANLGRTLRIVGYEQPQAGDGGTLLLAPDGVYFLSSVAGSFMPDELITASGGGTLRALEHSGGVLVAQRLTGTPSAAETLVGESGGASATIASVDQSPELVAEVGTASWRVLSWADDLGLEVTNEAWPTGGTHAVLDEIGVDRQVGRVTGESDEVYRPRVSALGDLVSPNAVLRAANRVLAPYGLEARMREVGLPGFRGAFFDGDPAQNDPETNFAYDMDPIARPADRWKVNLDLEEMRAFFLIELPRIDLGEFGVFYDVGICNAYDAAPWNNFFDGFPILAAIIYRSVWDEVDRTRAGGVGFDLVLA